MAGLYRQRRHFRNWRAYPYEKTVCAYLFLSGACAVLHAQDQLEVKFRSRALLDVAVSGYGKEDVQGYYRLEDFRVGFKAVYGDFEMKTDIGLGGGKLAIKDMLLNYHFAHGVLALGNGYEPFSMDMLISTADMRFHQSAASVLAFTDSRKLGATYHFIMTTGIWRPASIPTMTSIKSGRGRKMPLCLHPVPFGGNGKRGIG